MSHSRSVAVIATAMVAVASLCTGCGAAKAPQAQLDELVTAKGEQVVGIQVLRGQQGGTMVSIAISDTPGPKWYAISDGEIIESTHEAGPIAGTPTHVSNFSLASLVEQAETTYESTQRDDCPSATATANVTPSGKIGVAVSCSQPQDHPIIDDKSTLGGQPYHIPPIDFTTTDGIDTLRQYTTELFGDPHLVGIHYDFKDPMLGIDGPPTPDTTGQPCVPVFAVYNNQPVTPFPVRCETLRQQIPYFNIDDYGAQAITDVFTMISNADIDQSSLSTIRFTTDGTDLVWQLNTSNIGDKLNHPEIFSGQIPKR